jgi:hypothetical protein
MKHISKAFTIKAMTRDKAPEPEPEPILDDGVYWIRSITKDRYLGLCKYDRGRVIGQILHPAGTKNQQASESLRSVDVYIDGNV